MSSQVVEQQSGQQQGGVLRTTPSRASRSQLVQRLLAADQNLPTFLNDLLTTQAVSVVGTEAAAFLIERTQGTPDQGKPPFSLRPIAHMRPDESSDEVRQQALAAFQELIAPCVQADKDGAVEITTPDETGERQFCLITLLRSEGNSVAVSAVITRCADNERARQRLMSMQLVAGYFELYGMKRANEQTKHTVARQTRALQVINSVANSDGFQSAAAGICNELAQRTGASRVSLGWMKGENVRVKAISHTEKFDKRQELVVQLERVMEECLDQEQVVQFHPGGQSSPNVTREAQALSKSNGGQAVVSLPLRRKSDIVGVLTLEFDPKTKLDEDAAAALAVAADLVAPTLYDRFQNDRWLIVKAGYSLKNLGEATVGPKYMVTKLVVALVLGLLIFISVYSPMYKVSAPFQFVATVKRDIASPVEGYIEEVLARPGDEVVAGQVLATLKTTELQQKLIKARTEANAYEREAAKYHAEGKQADREISLLRAKMAMDEANFLMQQIEKHSIKSPIDGIVLKGDLRDKRGAPVKMGDVLFEVGQRGELEAELEVAESDIQELRPNQTGYLATQSLPNETYRFRVVRIVPVGEPAATGGNNVFKVYAQLEEQGEHWAPGLPGEARVEIEPRPLVYHWTHRAVKWIKLKLWL